MDTWRKSIQEEGITKGQGSDAKHTRGSEFKDEGRVARREGEAKHGQRGHQKQKKAGGRWSKVLSTTGRILGFHLNRMRRH